MGAWVVYGRLSEKREAFLASEARALQEVERLERSVSRMERTVERMRSDPVYIDHVIRTRLNYVKPGEVVFRFREE